MRLLFHALTAALPSLEQRLFRHVMVYSATARFLNFGIVRHLSPFFAAYRHRLTVPVFDESFALLLRLRDKLNRVRISLGNEQRSHSVCPIAAIPASKMNA